jgi:hypothetical protein
MNEQTKEYIKFGMMVLIMFSLLSISINQLAGYFNKTKIVVNPCQVCVDKNPRLSQCLNLQPSQWTINLTIPQNSNQSTGS